jgi:hypothetical protein
MDQYNLFQNVSFAAKQLHNSGLTKVKLAFLIAGVVSEAPVGAQALLCSKGNRVHSISQTIPYFHIHFSKGVELGGRDSRIIVQGQPGQKLM